MLIKHQEVIQVIGAHKMTVTGMIVNAPIVGNFGQKINKGRNIMIREKWEKSGLLQGIPEDKKEILATLLEQ
jgi:hypothetical protein